MAESIQQAIQVAATDGITTGIKVRKQRGLEIAALAMIEKHGG